MKERIENINIWLGQRAAVLLTEPSQLNEYAIVKQLIKDLWEENQTIDSQNKARASLITSMENSESSYRNSYVKAQREIERLLPLACTVNSERDINAQLSKELAEAEEKECIYREALKIAFSYIVDYRIYPNCSLPKSGGLVAETIKKTLNAGMSIKEQARVNVLATGYNEDSPGFDACVNAEINILNREAK